MPIYTAHLTRDHKTETRTIKDSHSTRTTTRPIVGYEKVVIDYPKQVLTNEDFTEFREAVLAAASPETEDWEPWCFNGALENGDCPAPPEMITPAESIAGKTMRKHASEYLFLYRNDDYTPFRVFEHWFCTVGNGMGWNSKGHYVSSTRHKKKTKADLKEDQDLLDIDSPINVYDNRPRLGDNVGLYPISEGYSDLFNIPANVEDSFLLAAIDICNYYLSRPTRYCVCYAPHEKDREIDYAGNTWQKMVMADASIYRTKLEKAYAEIWTIFGDRLNNMGINRVDYPRDDTPPGHFVPGDNVWAERALTPEERAEHEKFMNELLASLNMG